MSYMSKNQAIEMSLQGAMRSMFKRTDHRYDKVDPLSEWAARDVSTHIFKFLTVLRGMILLQIKKDAADVLKNLEDKEKDHKKWGSGEAVLIEIDGDKKTAMAIAETLQQSEPLGTFEGWVQEEDRQGECPVNDDALFRVWAEARGAVENLNGWTDEDFIPFLLHEDTLNSAKTKMLYTYFKASEFDRFRGYSDGNPLDIFVQIVHHGHVHPYPKLPMHNLISFANDPILRPAIFAALPQLYVAMLDLFKGVNCKAPAKHRLLEFIKGGVEFHIETLQRFIQFQYGVADARAVYLANYMTITGGCWKEPYVDGSLWDRLEEFQAMATCLEELLK